MRSNRGRDTRPEVRLRQVLFAAGLRYRKNLPVYVGGHLIRPDIAFTGRRVAVFVDGCFWHACEAHRSIPRSNRPFWTAKLSANRERDRRQSVILRDAGWEVVRVWEHERVADAAERISHLVNSRSACRVAAPVG